MSKLIPNFQAIAAFTVLHPSRFVGLPLRWAFRSAAIRNEMESKQFRYSAVLVYMKKFESVLWRFARENLLPWIYYLG